MASKVFLDANVLLDFALHRADYEVAKRILNLVLSGRIQGYVTPSVIHILGHWLTKAYGTAKAKEILLTLLTDVQCIDIMHDEVISALHSPMRDIEDALQYYSALHHKMDYFISRDAGLRRDAISNLPVYSPEEFVRELEGA